MEEAGSSEDTGTSEEETEELSELLSEEEADSLENSGASLEERLSSSTGRPSRKSAMLLSGASPRRSAIGAVSG